MRRALVSLWAVALLALPLPVLAQTPPDAGLVGSELLADGGVHVDGVELLEDGGYRLTWPDGGLDVPAPLSEGQPAPFKGVELSDLRARMKAAELHVCRDSNAELRAALADSGGLSAGQVVALAGGGALVGAAVAVVVTVLVRK